jgi:hypothetical protein
MAKSTVSDQPIDLSTSSPLARKVAQVVKEVLRVPKDGVNLHFGYRFVSDAAVLNAVRGPLADRNIAIFPSVIPETIVERPSNDKGDILTRCVVRFEIVDGDTNDRMVCQFPGAGIDRQDKGIYKAITGAEKYFLQKLLLIPTDDDPERATEHDDKHDEADQRAPAERRQAAQRQAAKPKPEPAPASTPAAAQAPAAAAGRPVLVSGLDVKSNKPDADKKWTLYIVKFSEKVRASDGKLVPDAATFDEKIAMAAENARDGKTPMIADVVPNPRKANTYELKSLTVADLRD